MFNVHKLPGPLVLSSWSIIFKPQSEQFVQVYGGLHWKYGPRRIGSSMLLFRLSVRSHLCASHQHRFAVSGSQNEPCHDLPFNFQLAPPHFLYPVFGQLPTKTNVLPHFSFPFFSFSFFVSFWYNTLSKHIWVSSPLSKSFHWYFFGKFGQFFFFQTMSWLLDPKTCDGSRISRCLIQAEIIKL